MKKFILFVMALILAVNVVAYAQDALQQPEYGVVPPITRAPVERLVPGELNITVNGKVIYFVCKPYVENGVSFAHGEKLLYEFGFDAHFDKNTGVLSASKDGKNLVIKAGENNARMVDGVLYIPVRAIAEGLGFTVNWNGDKYLVEIVGDQND